MSGDLTAVLADLAQLREQVTQLHVAHNDDQARIADLTVTLQKVTGQRRTRSKPRDDDDSGYRPRPAPRWWLLTGQDRADEITWLRTWVETVFRPGYGHEAARLGPCWDRHDLALYCLSWLAELHGMVFYAGERSLAAEADWHIRLLPGAMALLSAETGSCERHWDGAS